MHPRQYEAYVEAALDQAICEFLEDDRVWYCEVPSLAGAWSQGPTLEASRAQLAEVVLGWLTLGIEHGHRTPTINGIDVNTVFAD